MTALDFSRYVTGDSPEMKEFKKKVIEVAQNHSNNFHCGEYRSVLRELGIKENEPGLVRVKVKTSEDWEFEVDVDPDKMHALDEDAQKEELVTVFASKVDDMAGFKIKVPASQITEMEINQALSAAYVWRYISEDGRVRHAVPVEILTRRGYAYSGTGIYTACGQYVTQPMVSTNRAEDRNWLRCERRIE